MLYDISERIIQLNYSKDINEVKEFLAKQNLSFDKDIEYTVALYKDTEIVATGSFADRTLKCIAVDPQYKGQGLSNKVVSHLINEEYRRGNTHLFIYTKPENYTMFNDMGFYRVCEIDSVLLMENTRNGIKNYINELRESQIKTNNISSIVMNGNPFTLGHQYLIEYASNNSDVVHVFVVWEDKSTFPSEIRYRLIKEGTKHLNNVYVHKGKDYIISSATFPTYFIKDNVTKRHAVLDLTIFGKYIAPSLDITKRFVGQEPYCPVTKVYNETMKEILPKYDIEVIEIPRKEKDEDVISASKVRRMLKDDNFKGIKEIVPKSTYDFLVSDEARGIINDLKRKDSRH